MNAVIYAAIPVTTSAKNPSKVRFGNAQPTQKETVSRWSGTTLTVHSPLKQIIARIFSK